MRDENRIQKIADLLVKYWLQYPDTRFWQMIELLKSQMGDNGRDDQFYTEDSETELFLFRKVVDKATAVKWSQVTGIEVLDADGWISKGQSQEDFQKKMISFDEFMEMASSSTCRGNMSLFTEWSNSQKPYIQY